MGMSLGRGLLVLLLNTVARACIRPEEQVKKEDEGEEDTDTTPGAAVCGA